jgi:hypothetical protein
LKGNSILEVFQTGNKTLISLLPCPGVERFSEKHHCNSVYLGAQEALPASAYIAIGKTNSPPDFFAHSEGQEVAVLTAELFFRVFLPVMLILKHNV